MIRPSSVFALLAALVCAVSAVSAQTSSPAPALPDALAPPLTPPDGAADPLASDPVSAAEAALRLVIESVLERHQSSTLSAFDRARRVYGDVDVPLPSLDASLEQHVAMERRLSQLTFTAKALSAVTEMTKAASDYRQLLHEDDVADLTRASTYYRTIRDAQSVLAGSATSELVTVEGEAPYVLPGPVGAVAFVLEAQAQAVRIASVRVPSAAVGQVRVVEDQCSSEQPLSLGTSCLVRVHWDLGREPLRWSHFATYLVADLRGEGRVRQVLVHPLRTPDEIPDLWAFSLGLEPVRLPDPEDEAEAEDEPERPPAGLAIARPAPPRESPGGVPPDLPVSPPAPAGPLAPGLPAHAPASVHALLTAPVEPDPAERLPARVEILALRASLGPMKGGHPRALVRVWPPPQALQLSRPPPPFWLEQGAELPHGWSVQSVDPGQRRVLLQHEVLGPHALRPLRYSPSVALRSAAAPAAPAPRLRSVPVRPPRPAPGFTVLPGTSSHAH